MPRVVGILPNPATVTPFVRAVLAHMHDEWQAGDRRYLSEGPMSLLYPVSDTTYRRDRQRRVDTEDPLKAHHPAGSGLSGSSSTNHPRAHNPVGTHRRQTEPSPGCQAKTVCVPLVRTSGDSVWLTRHSPARG